MKFHLSQISQLHDQLDRAIKGKETSQYSPDAKVPRKFIATFSLESAATELDKELAKKKNHILIEGDKSFYNNTWIAGGTNITWNMVHYDVQLIGGAVLHSGKIAEMATGEGKTLVSTLPAYLNALTGEGVHIVTVNDYLSRRDSEWNGPLFE